MASYTANLASILVAVRDNNGIHNIDDAIAQRKSMCVVPQVYRCDFLQREGGRRRAPGTEGETDRESV